MELRVGKKDMQPPKPMTFKSGKPGFEVRLRVLGGSGAGTLYVAEDLGELDWEVSDYAMKYLTDLWDNMDEYVEAQVTETKRLVYKAHCCDDDHAGREFFVTEYGIVENGTLRKEEWYGQV